ncbi:DUF362 domain-containing protein [Chloroflexota bacterium]
MPEIKEIPVGRRGRENQVLTAGGKPILVIVEGKEIDAMVDAGLEAIGGLGRVINNNRQVLLKPNTNQRDPFPSITAPETMRAVARHCRAAGVEDIIVHEDHKGELDLYYDPEELPGMEIQLSHSPSVDNYILVKHDDWHGDLDVDVATKEMDDNPFKRMLQSDVRKTEGHCLRVARQVQEATVVINMPVLKRHFAGQLTSALKNHFGSVYGLHRWLAHSSLEKNRDYYDRKLAEFASAVRPELTITDIRSLQAVFGPMRTQETRIVEGVNRLIVTGDMVAADAVAMQLMKQFDDTFTLENETIVRRQQEHAEELGLGTSDLSQVEIIEIKV